MIADELEKMIFDFACLYHPETELPTAIAPDDQITEVITLNSLEWMILIAQIEEHFGVVLNSEAMKRRMFSEIVDNIAQSMANACDMHTRDIEEAKNNITKNGKE